MEERWGQRGERETERESGREARGERGGERHPETERGRKRTGKRNEGRPWMTERGVMEGQSKGGELTGRQDKKEDPEAGEGCGCRGRA